MTTVDAIERSLFDWAPRSLEMKGDNNGLVAGNRHAEVTHVLAALDLSRHTISEAIEIGAGLIVTHHPVVWGENLPFPNSDTDAGNILLSICNANLAAINNHTNLDAALGGINDVLAKLLGLINVRVFDEKDGIGRMGELSSSLSAGAFAGQCKAALGTGVVRYYDAGRTVHNVALCSGGGGFILEDAIKAGCDTFVTGEMKHSLFLTAQNKSVNALECGHFATENVIVPVIAEYLRMRFPDLKVSISKETEEPYQCL